MQCPFCGNRNFVVIARYTCEIEYDNQDNITNDHIDEGLGYEENSHFCNGCHKELKDKYLIKEKNDKNIKKNNKRNRDNK